ncbi:MAG TPA: AI-2E family transporter [Candidatus Paceibacterota bacterium]
MKPYFLLLLIALSVFLAFSILRPFLVVLALAVIFATVLDPVYKRLLSRLAGRAGLASLLTMLVLAVFVVTPLVILGVQILQEAQDLYITLSAGTGRDLITNLINTVANSLGAYLPGADAFSADLDQYIKQALSFMLSHLGGIFSGVASFVGSSVLFLIALYYLLRDGHRLRDEVVRVSPLSDRDDNTILSKLALAVNSVVRGRLLIALIQGVLCALGFLAVGVPNPFLWGSLAAVSAVIPGIGTALVLVPAVLYLFAVGQSIQGLGLLIWGLVVVGLIDNLLGPKLLGAGIKLHPLIILLSVLGGLAYFGPVGFLLGPLCMSLLFTLLDIYFSQVKSKP